MRHLLHHCTGPAMILLLVLLSLCSGKCVGLLGMRALTEHSGWQGKDQRLTYRTQVYFSGFFQWFLTMNRKVRMKTVIWRIWGNLIWFWGFPGGSDGEASACNAGDLGSIPGLGRSPGKGNGNPLQYSCLENSMDWGAWWATIHGVAKSQTQLSNFMYTRIPWRRKYQPTPVFLHGESHG